MPTYTSQYPTQDDDHVKVTTKYSTDYWPYYATDPTKSLIDTWFGNAWVSGINEDDNQRFHIDLGSAKIIRRIYYENVHESGAQITTGVRNFTLWGSNTGAGSFDDLVWGNDEGWTELTVAQNTFDQHIAANQADPKFIVVTNSTEYRYYAFKFTDNYGDTNYMGVRRIELQTEDGWTPTFEYAGTGSLTYSGSGICQYEAPDWEYISSGTYNFSGVGLYSLGLVYVGIGEFVYSGSATQVYTHCYLYVGSGEFTYSGEADFTFCYNYIKIDKNLSDYTKVDKNTSIYNKVDKGC